MRYTLSRSGTSHLPLRREAPVDRRRPVEPVVIRQDPSLTVLVEPVFADFTQEMLCHLILTGPGNVHRCRNRFWIVSTWRAQELVIRARNKMASQELALTETQLANAMIAGHILEAHCTDAEGKRRQ